MKKIRYAILVSAAMIGMLTGCGNTSSAASALTTSAGTASTAEITTSTSSGASTSTGHSGTPGGGQGSGSSSGSATYGYVSQFTAETTETGKTYASTSADQSAILVTGSAAKATIITPTVTKSGDTSSADNSSFYGQNASVLTKDAGTLYLKGGTISSTAEGGAGVASYGTGVSYVQGTQITTTANAAGGLHVCGGGTLYAYDVTAQTAGEHSAAIRSDRGGGTMVVDGGTYTATGSGSPAVYSTADITINNATMEAKGSEAAAIEGKNAIKIFNSTLTGNMSDSSQNDNTWGVILYQSMSGDSTVGTSEFYMVDSTLNIKNGGFFHSTNTSSQFLLHNVTLNHTGNDSYEYLIRACGSSRWGSGTGPTMNFTASAQTMEGKIVYDSASALDLYLKDASTWTGATEVSTAYTGSKTSSIHIESGSKWVVTGNSTIDNLYNGGTIVDASGNTVTIKAGSETKVTGTSAYTVTVTGTYQASAEMTSAVATPVYTAVSKPSVFD
jgi:hypothetical protein